MGEKIKKDIIILRNIFTVDKVEDGGQAKICSLSDFNDEENDNCIYVKIISWNNKRIHSLFNKFIGRKVKITIETEN